MVVRIKASKRGKAKSEFYHELYRLIAICRETPSTSLDVELGRFVAANGTVILNAVLMIPHFQTEAELQEEQRRLSTVGARIEELEAELDKLKRGRP